MSYSYFNEFGKRVTGAAANSHKTYKIHGGPEQQFKNIVGYALVGIMLAHGIRQGIKIIGEVILDKRKNQKDDDKSC